MSEDYLILLKGPRPGALCAAKKIQLKMQTYIGNGQRCQFKFVLLILKNICLALQSNGLNNVDICCDIVEKIILPEITWCSDIDSYWESFLGFLRYLHHMLGTDSTLRQQNQIYHCFKSKRFKLMDKTIYKYFLDIHMQHLNSQHQYQIQNSAAMISQINSALDGLGKLFEEMITLVESENANYPDLMIDLNKYMLGKRSSSFIKFLSAMPSDASQKMFCSLFKLLSVNKLLVKEFPTYNHEYLSGFLALLLLDVNSQILNQQLALEFIYCCKQIFRSEPIFNYFYQMLYYYVKFIYSQEKNSKFKDTYIELCNKFVQFYEQKMELNAIDQWLLEALVVIQRLQVLLHCYVDTKFATFWEQMKSDVDLYLAHFNLILCAIKLSIRIPNTSLGQTCNNENCNAVRKHVIFSLGSSALYAFSFFIRHPSANEKINNVKINDMYVTCASIVRYAINITDTMPCISPKNNEFAYFIKRFIYIGSYIKVIEQVDFYIKLIEFLTKIRGKIESVDWMMLLRRVYRISTSANHQLSSIMHCVYIAAQTNQTQLRKQIGFFYQDTKNSEKCISETLEECKTPLKSELTVTEKRRLYIEEMFFVLHYCKHNIRFLNSLLRCNPTSYDKALIVRHLRSEKDTGNRLKNVYAIYHQKLRLATVSRVEHLINAYTCTGLLIELIELQKVKIDFNGTTESGLEEWFTSAEIIKIDGEMERLKIATEALRSFEFFFYKADEQPLINEDILIDWESIIDDVSTIANALQLMGYMKETSNAWLLLYNITSTIDDRINHLRALTFFFMYSDLFKGDQRINLAKEANKIQNIISEILTQNFTKISKRHQTFILLCLCQMANYFSRNGYVQYSYILLSRVHNWHEELEDRKGKIDIIFLTMHFTRFRLLWHHGSTKALKIHSNVLRFMDMIFESFRSFVTISSVDHTACMLLTIELAQMCAECSANRIGDRISFVFTAINMSLQAGLALRVIQMLISLLWSNLQLEYVDKARSLLRIIDSILCFNIGNKCNITDNAFPFKNVPAVATENEPVVDAIPLRISSGFVEPIRKLANSKLPQQIENLQLNCKSETVSLQSYLDAQYKNKFLKNNEQLQWTYMTVGLFSARLYFLLRNYSELNNFYENFEAQIKKNESNFFFYKMYQNLNLVNSEYYVNFIRVMKDHKTATKFINAILSNYQTFKDKVDINYQYNLLVQLHSIYYEENTFHEKSLNFRRALQFSTFVDENLPQNCQNAKIYNVKYNNRDKIKNIVNNSPKCSKSSLKQKSSKGAVAKKVHKSTIENEVDLNACQIIETIDLDDTTQYEVKEIGLMLEQISEDNLKFNNLKLPINKTQQPIIQNKVNSVKKGKHLKTPLSDVDRLHDQQPNCKQISSRKRVTTRNTNNIKSDEFTVFKTRAQMCRIVTQNEENIEPFTKGS